MSDEGVQKGAILLLALGEDEAAEVMKFLGPREVQKLGAAMSAKVSYFTTASAAAAAVEAIAALRGGQLEVRSLQAYYN